MIRTSILALAAHSFVGLAQEPAEMATSSEPAIFRGGIEEVHVPVIVHDIRGRVVKGLRLEDFRRFDKTKPADNLLSCGSPVESGK